ncbi:MAG: AraC family transcriptional regulator [Bacteroides sp.]|nr:AraC family transcriptional regulator [Bacteroides sp.]MCM1095059.1 AraC family transcriptional regulator [Terasakiella sp.]
MSPYPTAKIITEHIPIPPEDMFYVARRVKSDFDFPIHRHAEMEVNFVMGCRGALRVAGDSVEELGDMDLVFIGHNRPHAWLRHKCTSSEITEITLQFQPDIFSDYMLCHSPFVPIAELLAHASEGVAFGAATTMKAYAALEALVKERDYFDRYICFLQVLRILAEAHDHRFLAHTPAQPAHTSEEDKRLNTVLDHIRHHYAEEIRLPELAAMAGMTPAAFARYFKLRTGRTTIEYVNHIRLGVACHRLFFSDRTVAEIAYECGFRSPNHFSRTFRNLRGCSPSEFRQDNVYRMLTTDTVDGIPHI